MIKHDKVQVSGSIIVDGSITANIIASSTAHIEKQLENDILKRLTKAMPAEQHSDVMLFGSRSKLNPSEVEGSDFDIAVNADTVRMTTILNVFPQLCFATTKKSPKYRDSVTSHIGSGTVYYKGLERTVQVVFKTEYTLFRKMWLDITPHEFEDYVWKHHNNLQNIRNYINAKLEAARKEP